MEIGIIGGGASGIYAAILLKKKHPSFGVTIIDKEDKLGRKLCATGNGHCNLLNRELTPEHFNNPSFIKPYLDKYPFVSLKKTLESWGIKLLANGNYVYPLTYSAVDYVAFLNRLVISLGIKTILGTRVKDYEPTLKGYQVLTDHGSFSFDEVIFANGGCSTPNLGSDGSLYKVLLGHGYLMNEPLPGLCPIEVKEGSYLKPLDGIRHLAKVSLYQDKGQQEELIHTEEGEVLFKDNGLSGIVIFNTESFILRKRASSTFKLVLDLFPLERTLGKDLAASYKLNPSFYLDAYLMKPLQKEVFRQCQTASPSFDELARTMHGLKYTFKSPYAFNHSQVTIGGIRVKEVNASLASLREKGIYFLGEVLDIDGECGGYNLSWALISALALSEDL